MDDLVAFEDKAAPRTVLQTRNVFKNRCDFLDSGLPWTGVVAGQDEGVHYSYPLSGSDEKLEL